MRLREVLDALSRNESRPVDGENLGVALDLESGIPREIVEGLAGRDLAVDDDEVVRRATRDAEFRARHPWFDDAIERARRPLPNFDDVHVLTVQLFDNAGRKGLARWTIKIGASVSTLPNLLRQVDPVTRQVRPAMLQRHASLSDHDQFRGNMSRKRVEPWEKTALARARGIARDGNALVGCVVTAAQRLRLGVVRHPGQVAFLTWQDGAPTVHLVQMHPEGEDVVRVLDLTERTTTKDGRERDANAARWTGIRYSPAYQAVIDARIEAKAKREAGE